MCGFNLPWLEPRLQARYKELVEEHLHVCQRDSCGVKALPSTSSTLAATMGAYRFYRNPSVDLPDLAGPLIKHAQSAIQKQCRAYGLVAHDESRLGYNRHDRKQDRIRLTHSHNWGYELRSALLLSDQDGQPLAPLCQELVCAQGAYSTRQRQAQARQPFVDEVTEQMDYVEGLKLARPLVHIVDAEGDAANHYRQWSKRRVLVRAKGRQRVEYQGRTMLLAQVAQQFKASGALRYCRQVEFKGRPAQQYVGETQVTITRPGRTKRKRGRRVRYEYIQGEPLTLRLVVSEVRSATGKVLASWLLLSNVEASVPAEVLALWYYWRWRIESFFKLLKSAGLQVEHWQQDNGLAIARRLLIGSMACTLVWQLSEDPTPEGAQLRQLLVRLSGRLMKPKRAWTAPALLAGTWVLLAMLDVWEHYDLSAVKRAAEHFIPI